MPSSYTRNLGLEKPATGEQAGTWGDTANNDYDFLDEAIDGNAHISIGPSGYTLSTTDGSTSEGRNKVIVWTGVIATNATVNIVPQDAEKVYIMTNATTGGGSIIFSQGDGGGGGTFTLAPGASAIIFCDGAGAGARVEGANYNPQFGSVIIQGQASPASIRLLSSATANHIEFRKDGAPSAASAIGLNVPGAASLTNDLVFSTYIPSVWTERMRIRSADGYVDVKGVLNVLQREVAMSNSANAGYQHAAIEIRETNLVATGETTIQYAPRLAFHWTGRGAAQIGMDSAGILKAMNDDGTLGGFQCSVLSVTTVNVETVNANVVTAVAVSTETVAALSLTVLGVSSAAVLNAQIVNATEQVETPLIVGVITFNADNINATTLAAGSANVDSIHTVSNDNGATAIARVYASNDGFIRYYTLANFANQIRPFIPSTPQTPWTSNHDQAGFSLVNSSDGIVRIAPGQQLIQSTQGEVSDAQLGATGLQFFTSGGGVLYVKFRNVGTGGVVRVAIASGI